MDHIQLDLAIQYDPYTLMHAKSLVLLSNMAEISVFDIVELQRWSIGRDMDDAILIDGRDGQMT